MEELELNEVVDDSDQETEETPIQYRITSFGADYDVDGLVKRLQREDIYIPPFQREYIWNLSEASRFIESLLLGLPVPGIFLAKEKDTNKLLVLDGQQRLKTLQFFFAGVYDPNPEVKNSSKIFRLTNVHPLFNEKTYDELSEEDQRLLKDTVIHATVIKQDHPDDNSSSIYHIFERLNTTGRKLSPQQIRVAIFHGPFMELLRGLNNFDLWRDIYRKKSKTLKDEELILRFLAFFENEENYKRPMVKFLNDFAKERRFISAELSERYVDLFTNTIRLVHSVIGSNAFRPERALNAAVFDSVMSVLAKKIEEGRNINREKLIAAYNKLLKNEMFQSSYLQATTSETNIDLRFALAREHFLSIE